MEKVTYKDITEIQHFEKWGEKFDLEQSWDKQHVYLYRRRYGWELVQAVKTKNPDGSIVYRYPSTNEWGKYGWSIQSLESRSYKRLLYDLGVVDKG